MIFVTIGLTKPFDRLLEALGDGAGGEELVVQCGEWRGSLPGNARAVEYLAFDELVEHVREARAVVCHAGVGSILVALAEGKRPVVVPRRAEFGEAPDDHQVALARRLADLDVVTLAESPNDVWAAVRSATTRTSGEVGGPRGLAEELGSYVAMRVAAR